MIAIGDDFHCFLEIIFRVFFRETIVNFEYMVQENSESIFHERLGHITESGLTQKSTRVETCLANIVFDQNDQDQTCSCLEESR